MSFFGIGPDNSTLARLDTTSNQGLGKIRWVANKDADVSGHVDTESVDGSGHWEMFVYAGNALVKYTAYHLTFDGDPTKNPKAISWTDANNDNTRFCCIAVEAVSSAGYGWVAVAGAVDAFVEGTTDVAVGDYLMIDTNSAAGLTALITSGGTVETNSTVAIAQEAQATAGVATTARVFLLGRSKICDQQ
jgi:hypothetical protein